MHDFRLLASLPLLTLATLLGCGGSSPVDPCPDGICPADSGRPDSSTLSDSGPGGDGGGSTPDAGLDAGPDATTPPRDGGGGCVEAWTCDPWETTGASDDATRSCVDSNACGTTLGRPALSTTLPGLDPEFFECMVEPVLTRGCAQLGCHGTESGRALRLYARGRLRQAGLTVAPHPSWPCPARASESCIGSLDCTCTTEPLFASERRRSFDSARAFALDASGSPLADMGRSDLIQQPLRGGGLSHAGVHFWSAGDSDPQTIQRWLEGARLGRTCNSGD